MPLHDKEVTKESHAAHSDADDASNEEAVKVLTPLVDIARQEAHRYSRRLTAFVRRALTRGAGG